MFALEAQGADEPASVVGRVNMALFRRGIESRFATLFYGVISKEGHLRYATPGTTRRTSSVPAACRSSKKADRWSAS